MDCVFCKIVAGKVPSYGVCDNDGALAVLDVFPHAKGHTVVMPRDHIETVVGCSADQGAHFFAALQEAVRVLDAAFRPDGFTIGINHGTMAGQAIPHLHAHVIPRYKGDGGGSIHSVVKSPAGAALEEVAAQVRQVRA